jgi:hypothetical protein
MGVGLLVLVLLQVGGMAVQHTSCVTVVLSACCALKV